MKKGIKIIDEERMPELGNMVFGNSFGEYPLKRGVGVEEELGRLFDAIDPKRDTSWGDYGVEFENDVFFVFPYYWLGCSCGFDSQEFTEEHRENCFQSELLAEKLKNGWKKNENTGWLESPYDWDTENKKERKIVKSLYQKRGLDTSKRNWWHGCMSYCDCDYNERYEKWLKEIGYPNGCKNDCLLMKPNFLYKPTGLWIKWYKYVLRDAYISQRITLEDFHKIIDECIKSLELLRQPSTT